VNESQPSKRPRVIAAVVAAMVIVAVIAIVLNSRSGDKSGPGQDDQANAAATTGGEESSGSKDGSGSSDGSDSADASGSKGSSDSAGATTTTVKARDQRKDVKIDDCTAKGGPKVTITNESDEPSKFLVVVEITDDDGKTVGNAGGPVGPLKPGKSADVTLKSAVVIPRGATCKVSQLVRTPS
jgi:hypothetical protein